MTYGTMWCRGVAAAALLFAAGTATEAGAALAITDAKIEGGKLVVTGTTALATQAVQLDGKFNATSSAQKVFTFSLSNYHPDDCVVQVKVGAAAVNGVVANCGVRGVTPLGAWASATAYVSDNVVSHLGSSWRAKRASIDKAPGLTNPSTALDWEKFVSKGDTGVTGATGLRGLQGVAGATGATGLRGFSGAQGTAGAVGPIGSTGFTGANGANGADGATGATGATGPEGPYRKLVTSGVEQFTMDTEQTGQTATKAFRVPYYGTISILVEMKSGTPGLTATASVTTAFGGPSVFGTTTSEVYGAHTITTLRVVAGDIVTILGNGVGTTVFLRNLKVYYDVVDADGTAEVVTDEGTI